MKRTDLLKDRRTGDITVMRSKSITGIVMRSMQMFRNNIPWAATWSHIQMTYNKERDMSAVAGGVKLIDATAIRKGAEVKVFRLDLDEKEKEALKKAMDRQLGKSYAFARHWLDFFVINIPIAFIWANLTAIPAWLIRIRAIQHVWWFLAGLFVFSCITGMILKKFDRQTVDCSENVETALSEPGIITAFAGRPRAATPTLQYYLLYNKAKVILEGVIDD